ncbi:hypothetical protein A2U01_0054803, partial [Trifolium medium]|nr:hypothetical protein [Trifolium medium]
TGSSIQLNKSSTSQVGEILSSSCIISALAVSSHRRRERHQDRFKCLTPSDQYPASATVKLLSAASVYEEKPA